MTHPWWKPKPMMGKPKHHADTTITIFPIVTENRSERIIIAPFSRFWGRSSINVSFRKIALIFVDKGETELMRDTKHAL